MVILGECCLKVGAFKGVSCKQRAHVCMEFDVAMLGDV